jgi:hypothetical protein
MSLINLLACVSSACQRCRHIHISVINTSPKRNGMLYDSIIAMKAVAVKPQNFSHAHLACGVRIARASPSLMVPAPGGAACICTHAIAQYRIPVPVFCLPSSRRVRARSNECGGGQPQCMLGASRTRRFVSRPVACGATLCSVDDELDGARRGSSRRQSLLINKLVCRNRCAVMARIHYREGELRRSDRKSVESK